MTHLDLVLVYRLPVLRALARAVVVASTGNPQSAGSKVGGAHCIALMHTTCHLFDVRERREAELWQVLQDCPIGALRWRVTLPSL